MWVAPQPQHSVLPHLDKGCERRNGVPRMGLYLAPCSSTGMCPPAPWALGFTLGQRKAFPCQGINTLLGTGAEGPCPDPVREARPGHRGALEDLWLLFL